AGLKEKVKEKTLQIEQLNESQKEFFIRLAAQAYMSVLTSADNNIPEGNAPTSQPYENSFKKYNLPCREIEVLPMLIKGHSYKVIADELHISEKTVSKHISNIFAKTGVTNKVELINNCYRLPGNH
ncbi:MAG TPA: response regulator transcription factor, partial [Ohtaekwangia sp.]|nr:response regulator transcription factor [Ohtaekwangia sp.]